VSSSPGLGDYLVTGLKDLEMSLFARIYGARAGSCLRAPSLDPLAGSNTVVVSLADGKCTGKQPEWI